MQAAVLSEKPADFYRSTRPHVPEHLICGNLKYNKTVQFVITLTFQSLAVSLLTARFNIQKFYMALALR